MLQGLYILADKHTKTKVELMKLIFIQLLISPISKLKKPLHGSLEKARAAADELGMKELLVKAQKWEKILGDSSDVKVETENDDGCDGEGSTVIDNSVPSSVASEVDHQVCKDVIESLGSLEEKKVIDERMKERITYLCRSDTIDLDGKTTDPIYKLVSQNDDSPANKKRKESSKFF